MISTIMIKTFMLIFENALPSKVMAPKKLLVLGASGNTGQHLVKQALERDHTVTALVRSYFSNLLHNTYYE
jgi:hypothetical protein